MVLWLTVLHAGCTSGNAVSPPSDLDQRVEDAVVGQDVEFLSRAYADTLVYTHADGSVEGLDEWLADVQAGGYVTRRIEHPAVERHGDVVVTSGRLVVSRVIDTTTDRYAVTFVRVYAWRGGHWQMLSHRGLALEELAP